MAPHSNKTSWIDLKFNPTIVDSFKIFLLLAVERYHALSELIVKEICVARKLRLVAAMGEREASARVIRQSGTIGAGIVRKPALQGERNSIQRANSPDSALFYSFYFFSFFLSFS